MCPEVAPGDGLGHDDRHDKQRDQVFRDDGGGQAMQPRRQAPGGGRRLKHD